MAETSGVGRVLVIDDSPQNVSLVRTQLERAGYWVTDAGSGRAGLDAVAAAPPDVVLLDVQMPGLDGYEVCRRLKSADATRPIPVIMLTALNDREHKIRGLEAGADEFLSKPADRAELIARVRSLVRMKRLYDELIERRNERDRLLAAVEHERATLDAVMTSMSDGLLVVDGDHRVRFCNARAGTLLGIEAANAVGRPADELTERLAGGPELDSLRAAWTAAAGRPTERARFELTAIGPEPRALLVELFPVVRPTAARDYGVVLRDVTRERELERVKDELVSVVSHELRTPLASLVGFAELLMMRDYGLVERREFLTIMVEEGQRLTALINDFLDLQRIESGRQQIAPTPTAVADLLHRAANGFSDDPARPLIIELSAGLPLVAVDADRVHQVLTNLIGNARKFSPNGGAVTVAARVAAGEVEISVSDLGLGIPPEAVPRLFEKFYRVDTGDRREIKGTGLGLAICQKIVSAHGGRIWAESAGPGQGSRFCLTLPLVEEQPTEADVLVVEDDPGFGRLLAAELAAIGLSTARVTTAETAAARLATTAPRAVVLDLVLPGLQGEAFLPRLRAAAGDQLPVVVVSVKDLGIRDRAEPEQLGVVAILRKGSGTAGAAARTIKRILDGRTSNEQDVRARSRRKGVAV